MADPAPMDLSETSPAVSISGLDFRYDGLEVLRGVDLLVRRGDFMAVVGPNGGGKTTLLKLILGLLHPDRGEIEVLGGSPARARGRLGYVPQQVEARAGFPVTVMDVVLMGLPRRPGRLRRLGARDKVLVESALHEVELSHAGGRRMDELSGGQRQRAYIARALASDPEMLLLDEPTANVDPHGRFCFYELLAGLSSRVTVMVVSHDLSILASHVTSIACVNKKLISNPSPELTPEMLTLLYGSHDHTCAMDSYIKTVPEHIKLAKDSNG